MSASSWALGGLLVFGLCDVIALDALVAPRALATPAGGAPSLIARAVAPHAVAPARVGPGHAVPAAVAVAAAAPAAAPAVVAPAPAPAAVAPAPVVVAVASPAPAPARVPAARETSDASPPAPAPAPAAPALDLERHPVLIYFASDTAALAPDSFATLDQIAAGLAAHSRRTIVIVGHADERGTTLHNDALSARRMRHVRDYLAVQGVSRARMTGHAVGSREPATPGTSDDALAANRRVEIRLERRSR